MINKLKYLITFFLFITNFQVLHSDELSLLSDEKLDINELNILIKEYILKNPEIIIEAIEIYQKRQNSKTIDKEKKLIKSLRSEILDDKNSYQYGDKNSKTTIVEFIDYNCGYCKKTLLSINELLKKYKNLKVVFIDFPILSESSYSAAQAAIAAYKQNAYFKYHSALLNSNKKISNSYLLELAKNFNLDLVKFEKDMKSKNTANLIENNIKFARQLNIRGTPTFIINKEIYAGAYDTKKLEEILNKI